jgi:hypothetical protein
MAIKLFVAGSGRESGTSVLARRIGDVCPEVQNLNTARPRLDKLATVCAPNPILTDRSRFVARYP